MLQQVIHIGDVKMAHTKRYLQEKQRDEFIHKLESELNGQKYGKATQKNYKYHVGVLLDSQGTNVKKISKPGLNAHLTKTCKGKSRAYQLQAAAAIRFFYDYIVGNPAMKTVTHAYLERTAK